MRLGEAAQTETETEAEADASGKSPRANVVRFAGKRRYLFDRTDETKRNVQVSRVSRGEVQTRAVGGLGRVVVEMVNTRRRDGMG